MAFLQMKKDAAYEFCAKMNKTLPKQRVRVIDAPRNFENRHYWLDVNFSFPNISVSDSPLKNDVEKTLQRFKLHETPVLLMRFANRDELHVHFFSLGSQITDKTRRRSFVRWLNISSAGISPNNFQYRGDNPQIP